MPDTKKTDRKQPQTLSATARRLIEAHDRHVAAQAALSGNAQAQAA